MKKQRHTPLDPEDHYGAGASRTHALREDYSKYNDRQPRAGGREVPPRKHPPKSTHS